MSENQIPDIPIYLGHTGKESAAGGVVDSGMMSRV